MLRVGVASSRSFSGCARFDRFQIDLSTGELRKSGGSSIRIQQQPLQVLRLLLEAEGRVVTREQLRFALWSEETFVDFEHGVNTAVKKLRQALEDSAESPNFVETVPKIGYRFIIPVEWIANGYGERALNSAVPSASPLRKSTRARRLFTMALAMGLPIVAAASFFLYRSSSPRSKALQPSVHLAVASVGEKYSPSLSPDGQQLAFAWNGGQGPYFSIYVKRVGTEESQRLTKQASIDFNPVWSPDGRYIAFCRIKKGETGIYIAPAFGGLERKVRDTHWEEREFYEVFWYFGRLSW